MAVLHAALNADPNPSIGGGNIAIVDSSALLGTGGASEPTQASEETSDADHNVNGQVSIYVVREGDSLSQIASLFGVSVNTIRWANNLNIGDPIHEGQTLVILPITGVEHTVRPGETIEGIAQAFHGDAQEILRYNGLSGNGDLKSGMTITIPDGEIPATSSSDSVPSSSKTSSSKTSASASVKATVSVKKDTTPSTAKANGYFIAPLKHYVKTQGIHGHNAVDLAAPEGTSIYAAASGKVIVSRGDGGWNGGYGNYVVIQHPNGEQTLYAHMSKDIVSVGAHVVQGQVIGYVGTTGESTGDHLHFEVHGGVNPF